MQVSFIVTSYNVAPFIRACLDSLCAVLAPGDQLIIVDDGSRDGTVADIRSALADLPWPEEVELCPVFLGRNTHGGVGIGANIGLSRANREVVFFVAGDDWLVPAGVTRARQGFATSKDDILVANYQVFDVQTQRTEDPPDQMVWSDLATAPKGADAARHLALRMNALPGRKFYRRAFLQHHAIRFPEGDFRFEDKPFHWQVCLSTQRIGFCDVAVACQRLNHPGQTLREEDAGLGAMFQHYETILAHVARLAPATRPLADHWLASTMTWQLEQLSPEVIFTYAAAAETTLCGRRRKRWQRNILPSLAGHEIGFYLTALLEGGAQALAQVWLQMFTARQVRQQLTGVQSQLDQLAQRQQQIEQIASQARDMALGSWNQVEFTAAADFRQKRGGSDEG